MKFPKMILIEWRDVASADIGMFSADELDTEKIPHAFIIGFLVKESKQAYYVAKEYWDSNQFKYLHVVPKDTAIIKIVELKG